MNGIVIGNERDGVVWRRYYIRSRSSNEEIKCMAMFMRGKVYMLSKMV